MYSAKRRFRLFRSPAFAGGAIANSLTTSLAAYLSSPNNSWVKITSSEYTSLQTNVLQTSFAGTTPATFAAIGTKTELPSDGLGLVPGEHNLIITNANVTAAPAIPANSYVYAVAFYVEGANSQTSVHANNSIVAPITNFSKIGSTLPTTTAGNNYYVLTGISTVTATTDGLLAVSTTDSGAHGFAVSTPANGGFFTNTGTPANLTTATTLGGTFDAPAAVSIQALTTTLKQW